jgi:mannose-6-phosphate isomerase-like protein (cupin superfamily)/oxalate decarboxylase/phosphoglucose isomerase-like protein (cupin superfamily)
MAAETEVNAAPLEELEITDPYVNWQRDEGAPVITGFYLQDLSTVELGPWERKGGRGAFVNLEGCGGVNDTHVVEIKPGGQSEPERHLYEEFVYIVSGRGSTSVWYDEKQKQTFEWARGSLFAIPLNANYQHFNGSGLDPARYMAVTTAPSMLRILRNRDFIFNNPYQFPERFTGEAGYFSGEGKIHKSKRTQTLVTNFVADVHSLGLHSWKERGGGGDHIGLELAENSTGAHISEFQIGTYKKGHRHGPGAHVIILDGDGFSTLWRDGDPEMIKCDWRPGAVIVPPENWFHQHFNTGNHPARYLALRYQGRKYVATTSVNRGDGDISVKLGGNQIEYEDEDPKIHKIYESELAAHGATCRMKGYIPGCTGEVGPSISQSGD